MSLQEQPNTNFNSEQRELHEYQARLRTRVADIRANKDGNE